jgi:hypothetical protein
MACDWAPVRDLV